MIDENKSAKENIMSTKGPDIPIEFKINLFQYRVNTCYVEILSLFQEILSTAKLDKLQQQDYQQRLSQKLEEISQFSKEMESLILNKPAKIENLVKKSTLDWYQELAKELTQADIPIFIDFNSMLPQSMLGHLNEMKSFLVRITVFLGKFSENSGINLFLGFSKRLSQDYLKIDMMLPKNIFSENILQVLDIFLCQMPLSRNIHEVLDNINGNLSGNDPLELLKWYQLIETLSIVTQMSEDDNEHYKITLCLPVNIESINVTLAPQEKSIVLFDSCSQHASYLWNIFGERLLYYNLIEELDELEEYCCKKTVKKHDVFIMVNNEKEANLLLSKKYFSQKKNNNISIYDRSGKLSHCAANYHYYPHTVLSKLTFVSNKQVDTWLTREQETPLALCIEDNASMRSLYACYFKSVLPQMKIDFTETAKESVHMIKKNNYSIVFVDIMLPDLSGLELVERLSKQYAGIPFIAVTALTLPKEKWAEHGFSDYYVKPKIFEQLESIVSKYNLLH